MVMPLSLNIEWHEFVVVVIFSKMKAFLCLQKKEFILEKQVMRWFIQITMAVQYMHSQRILHRSVFSTERLSEDVSKDF